MSERIFISYSHADATTVNRITQIIEHASSLPVWFDNNLRGGDNFFSVIANQIVECDYFVFIVSANSIISDWCLRELEFAASERKRILAVLLDKAPIPPRIKLVIQNTHYIEYDSSAEEHFSDSIRKSFSSGGSFFRNQAPDNSSPLETWSETYFLETEKLRKIDKLLSCEKNKKYSLCFESENACLLGLAYELGIKTAIDIKKATFYYKISDFKGNYDGKYLYAAIRRKNDTCGNPGLYLPEMLEATEHNSVYALTHLGDDYYYGRNGCVKDISTAYMFWKKAASYGGITAMYYLACGYRHGEYLEKDIDLSYMYTLMAIEHGFPRAYRILAFMLESGDFGYQDYDKAIEMYDEAIKRGDHLSLCYQGCVYGKKGDLEKKRVLYEQALELAEAGIITAPLPYYRMGILYEFGEGVVKDIVRAVEFYLQAAAKKNTNAIKYAVSAIMKIDDSFQIEHYLKRALDLGCKNAAYELGKLAQAKCGSGKLCDAAVDYFTLGAEACDLNCVAQLIFKYSLILGDGQDRKDRLSAIKWFQFFFANMDDEYLSLLRDNNLLATYYYAYAVELDYDPEENMPDREFVQFYFKKSLEESPIHLPRITGLIVDGYLFPDESDSGLKLDVKHAEEVLKLVEGYLDKYHSYLSRNDPTEKKQNWNKLADLLDRGYTKIAECYRTGKSVPKDRIASKKHMEKALQIRSKMDTMFFSL